MSKCAFCLGLKLSDLKSLSPSQSCLESKLAVLGLLTWVSAVWTQNHE